MMQAPQGRMTETAAAPVLSIGAVTKRFGALTVLDRCALDVAEGEIVTLLGPSGCGKTTLLRCIAGFWAPDDGSIRIDGADMATAAVNRRPVGVVFQSYALFPHLTVAENVGYGLRMRRVKRAEIERRVAAALDTVSLADFADRYPARSPAGSSSGSRSRACSCWSRGCCCSTSRSTRSTPSCAASCRSSCAS
jgi:ABC-type Fe3+/spermidine/putrescine transport system ATPase subunit